MAQVRYRYDMYGTDICNCNYYSCNDYLRFSWISFMMGTHESIDESENVFLVTYMEEECLRRAKERRFIGIMTTNTNPLTQV
jgi:hypothetical protein